MWRGLEIPEFAKEWVNEHGNVNSIKVNSAIARFDLLGGGGRAIMSTKGTGCYGGSGGMVPRKILKYRVSEIAFSAFREH